MAFHPNYAKNRRFYVNYTDLSGHTRVVEFRSDGRAGTARHGTPHTLRSPAVSRTTTAASSSSGPTGSCTSAWGTAESGGDPHNNGQSPRALLAKLLRTNPLAVDWEIAGYGLRNPWRFSFDRTTGDLYIGDVGPERAGGDRLPAARRAALRTSAGPGTKEAGHSKSDVELDPPTPLVFPISRVRPRRRVLGHGRLRLPRQRRAGRRRPVLLRRLLLGDGVEPEGRRRQGNRRAARALRCGQPHPRSARAREASSTSSPTKATSTASRARRTEARRASRRRPRRDRARRAAGRGRPAPPPAAPAGERRPGGLRPPEPEAPAGSEGADAHAFGGQPPQLGVGGRVRPQVDAGMVFRKTLQQPAPVADGGVQGRLIHPVVQLHAIAALRVRQPGPPEGLGVAEHGIEVDDDRRAARHARTLRAARPRT